MGCTGGMTEGMETLPAGLRLQMLQLATWGALKYHGQSAEQRLSLLGGNNTKNVSITTPPDQKFHLEGILHCNT